MTRRTAECYEAVFRYIENNIFQLEPSVFMTDFEGGLRNAINSFYPRARLRGCWFHYCSALNKKATALGLKKFFKNNSSARLIKHELMCLPLLPADSITTGFKIVERHAQREKVYERLDVFFQYFEKYWIKTQNMINCLSLNEAGNRTTSSMESLNAKAKHTFDKHPHIFKFMESLQRLEFEKSTMMLQLTKTLVSERQLQPKHVKYIERDAKIQHLLQLLRQGSITIGELLPAVFVEKRLEPDILGNI